MRIPIQRLDIPEAEQTPLVEQLLELALADANQQQAELIQQLRDEIAIMKGEKTRPKFKPSGMVEQADQDAAGDKEASDESGGEVSEEKLCRPGSSKRAKTQVLEIHENYLAATLASA